VYLVGRDSVRGRELTFRLDRMREVRLSDRGFEKPRSFSAQRYRRADFYRTGPGDVEARVRFGPGAARYVREMSPSPELDEKPGGSVERRVRTDSLRWVVDWALQHGKDGEVKAPPAARAEMRQVLDQWIALHQR
jgi:predicted DNA-binding transcriptional regulator YafY